MNRDRLIGGIIIVVFLLSIIFVLAMPFEKSSQTIMIEAEKVDPEAIHVQPTTIKNDSLDSQYLVGTLEEAKRGEQSSVMISKKEAKHEAINDLPDEAPHIHTETGSGYYVKWKNDYYLVEIWKLV